MLADHYLIVALNFFLGVGVGAYGTLVGAGGGFLLVPIFLLLHKLPHEMAVGTSLAIVTANALSGTAGYIREKKIDYRAGIFFALFTFPGAVAGAFTTGLVSGSTFSKIFGVLLAAVALYLFFGPRRKEILAGEVHAPPIRKGWGWIERTIVTAKGTEHYSYFEPVGFLFSILVGAISSWFGIGGGIVHVPLMTQLLGFPVTIAVGTSHFILTFTALTGAAIHASQGHMNWEIALSAGAGALVGAQIGIYFSRRTSGSNVLRALSLALLAVSIRLLWG